jgi:murein DD-endopeptidase MepM/ murein hydrolase activator NlpD
MLHQVQGNDTLAAIAAKYKVETTAITGYRANNVAGADDLVPNSYVLVVGGQIPTRERIEEYVVRNGDTLWSIAERFGLQPSTIVWANSLTNADVLVIGQPLIVPPINGVIHRIGAGESLDAVAERYGVKPAEIAAFAPNGLGGGSPLVPGQDIIVPGGTPPAPPPPLLAEAPPAPAPPPAADPAPAAPVAPAAPTGGAGAVGSFIWPATGALTTYFGDNPAYYGPGGHNGLDIANGLGTPLLAADGGVVIYAAWRGGLGNAVGVDHENGFVTWYGHASSLAVGTGQRVSRGQVVAAMGSTGNSTGSTSTSSSSAMASMLTRSGTCRADDREPHHEKTSSHSATYARGRGAYTPISAPPVNTAFPTTPTDPPQPNGPYQVSTVRGWVNDTTSHSLIP